MFNINKLMRLVKNGEFFNKSFNIKKKADIFEEQGNVAAPTQDQRNIPPIPSNIPVQMPTQVPVQDAPQIIPQIPEELEQRMDLWIKENNREIAFETSKGPEGESYIGPDVILFRELTTHPEYRDILSNKIIMSNPEIGKHNSDLIVNTMMSKTQGIMGDIEERESGISRQEEEERQQREKIEEQRGLDPYSSSVPLPDPGLIKKVYEKFTFLSNKGKEEVYNLMHMRYNEEMLSQSSFKRFGEPEQGKIDQRMNFFLYNPQFLEPIIQQDPEFAEKLESEKSQPRKINVLNNEKGPLLHQILGGLIDRFDPSIIQWLKKGFGFGQDKGEETYRELSETEVVPESDEGRSPGLEGKTSKDFADLSITGADKEETSKLVSNATKYYLQDNMDEMDIINKVSSQAMMEEAKNKFIDERTSPAEKKQYLKRYSIGEKLNSYYLAVSDQLEKLFSERGKGLTNDIARMVYRNAEGQLMISNDIMKNMLGVAQRYEAMDPGKPMTLLDYKDYIKIYKDRIRAGKEKDPFVPDWKKMINYRVAMNSMAGLGEIKSKIFDLKRQGHKDPNAIMVALSGGRNEGLLKRFSNVEENDPLANKKIYDFIYMTLQQNPKGPNLKAPMQSYEDKKVIDKLEEDIKNGKGELSVKYNGNKEKKIKDNEDTLKGLKRQQGKNLKAIVGTSYIPLLAYVAKEMDRNKFLPGSLHGFIELFDQHPTKLKNFMSVGQQRNPYDDYGRTNTELYYKVRGEDPPKHVKVLYDLYNEGLETYEEKTGVPKKTLEPGSWYSELFDKYNSFDILQKAAKDKQVKIDKAEEMKKEREEMANNRAVRDIGNPKKKQQIIDNIKDPLAKEQFIQTIEKWDGMTELDPIYYSYLGQKTTAKKLQDIQDIIKKLRGGLGEGKRVRRGEEGLTQILQDMSNLKMELKRMLKNRGMDIDLSALRLASIKYKSFQNRLLKLAQMKKSNYKFASNFDFMINNIKNEFDQFFISLFS